MSIVTIHEGLGPAATSVETPIEDESFSALRAHQHIERLHFPRRTGTEGESRALRYLEHVLASSGQECRRERFPVAFLEREVAGRLAFATSAALVLAGLWCGPTQPLTATACWAVAGLLVHAPWRLNGASFWRRSTRLHSENLIACLPWDEVEIAPARVVFMAHHDTKSQRLPTGVRVGLVIAATVACGLLVTCGLTAAAMAPGVASGELPLAISALAVISLLLLAANVTGNLSPGALDNGSGLGVLLELARTWRPRPGAPVEAYWVATGAEELGLDGARELLRGHERWWRRKPTLLINLDSVGAGGRLYLAGEPGALGLAAETADRLGITWARLRYLGAGMDHEPFAARGLPAVSLLGDVISESLSLHSGGDTLERVDDAALERAGELAAQIAWEWAERLAAVRTVTIESERDDASVCPGVL